MARIMAIDYGIKRTGLAVSDPLGIIATPLTTVPSKDLLAFIKQYVVSEPVSDFVIGMPKTLNNEDSTNAVHVRKIMEAIRQSFPSIMLHTIDERFTTTMALDTMLRGGMKKKDRRNKNNIDKISATIILQSFMDKKH